MPDPFKLPAIGAIRPTDDPVAPYRPEQIEIDAELKQRQEQPERSLFYDVLEAPSVLFGAHAIRGLIRGAGEGGFSGAIEGFYRGLPTTAATDFFGITDGAFRLSYTDDVRKAFGSQSQSGARDFVLNFLGDVLTDPSSFVTLFGKTAKGVAAGMDIAAGLAQGVRNGERAALLFKYPFMPRVALWIPGADAAFRKMGFQSLSLNVAEGIDAWASWMRVGPMGSLARSLSINMPAIADPEAARAVARAGRDLMAAPAAMETSFLEVFAQTPRDAQEFLLSSKSAQRVAREMRERGLRSFDESHSLRAILESPAEIVGVRGSAVEAAGRKAGVGDLRTAAEKARDAVDGTQAAKEASVIESARAGLLDDVDTVAAEFKKNPELQRGFDRYLVNSIDFMRRLGDKEVAEGMLNGTMEHYVPRSFTPVAIDLINRRFDTHVRSLGETAVNRAASFMKGRKFTDLTTVEANAIVRELGTKATGYVPLNDLAKAAEQEAGFFTKIFDSDFVKRMRGVDDDAADFFSVNPIYADFLRARASGQVLGAANYRKHALRAISKGEFAAKDLPAKAAEIQALTDKGYVPVIEGRGGRIDPMNEAAFVGKQVGRDGHARFLLARDRLRDAVDSAIDAETADVDRTIGGLRKARDLKSDVDLRILDDDDAAAVMMKTALQDETAALEARRVASEARKGLLGYEPAKRLYDEAAAAADRRLADVDFVKRQRESLAAGVKAAEKEAKALRDAVKQASKQADAEAADFEFFSARADYESGAASKAADRAAAADAAASRAAAELPERLAAVEARKAALEADLAHWSEFKDDVKLGRSKNARQRLIDAHLRDLQDEAAERLSRARTNSRSTRAAIQSQIDEIDDDLREWKRSTFTDRKAGEAELEALRRTGQHGAEMARRIRGYRTAAREGLLPFNALTPEQQAVIARKAPDMKVHFVAPDDMRGVTEHYRDLSRPDPWRKHSLVRGLDQITGIWKAWTVGNVAFVNGRVRDAVTGLATLSFARGGALSPSALWDANKAARVFRKVMAGHGTIDDLGGEVIKGIANPNAPQTVGQVLRFMADNGALDSGLIRDTVVDSAANAVRQAGGTKLSEFFTANVFKIDPRANPFTRKGYEVANYGDNMVKLTGFIDALKRGETPEAALDFVRRHTYNPGQNATSFMRQKVRRVFPFGQFTAWAIGKTVEQFLSRPLTSTWISTVQRNADATVGVSENVEAILPDFIKDGVGVPYKMGESGPRYFLFGGYFPAAEVGKLAAAIESIGKPPEEGKAGGVYRYVVNQLNPLAKAAIERAANADSFSGSEIEAYEGQAKEMFGIAMPAHAYQLIRNVRLLAVIDKLNVINLDQAKVMVDAVDRGSRLGDREQLPFVQRVASSAFGIAPPAYQVDVAEQVREARRTAERRRFEATARLRRSVTDAPPGQRRDANIEALRQELVEAAADAEQTEVAAREFNVQETIRRKARATLSFGRGFR